LLRESGSDKTLGTKLCRDSPGVTIIAPQNSRPDLHLVSLFDNLKTHNQRPSTSTQPIHNERVLNTRGLETAPSQNLWKSEKLFHYRASEWITADNGPFKINLDLATGQDFSVPIIAGDLIYFTYVATDGYLYAIEKVTGQKLLILKFDKNAVSWPAAKDNIVFFGSARGQVHQKPRREMDLFV
jgi:hypothetical protein